MPPTLSACPSLASHCATTSRPPPLTASLMVRSLIAYRSMVVAPFEILARPLTGIVRYKANDVHECFDINRSDDVESEQAREPMAARLSNSPLCPPAAPLERCPGTGWLRRTAGSIRAGR